MEDVRGVGDGLAHGGQRNRDGERGAEPPVLGLASCGRDGHGHGRGRGRDRA